MVTNQHSNIEFRNIAFVQIMQPTLIPILPFRSIIGLRGASTSSQSLSMNKGISSQLLSNFPSSYKDIFALAVSTFVRDKPNEPLKPLKF